MKCEKSTFDAGRRRFCKLAALALGAAAMPSLAKASVGVAADYVPAGSSCRLRVVRCNCFDDLQSRWLEDPEQGTCQLVKAGAEIEITPATVREFDAGRAPEEMKLCRAAWLGLRPYIVAAMRKETPDECFATSSGGLLVSCPSGSNPVTFLIQR